MAPERVERVIASFALWGCASTGFPCPWGIKSHALIVEGPIETQDAEVW